MQHCTSSLPDMIPNIRHPVDKHKKGRLEPGSPITGTNTNALGGREPLLLNEKPGTQDRTKTLDRKTHVRARK